MIIFSELSGIFLLAGFLLLAHGHNRKSYIKNLLTKGRKTEGKIVELRRNPGALFSKTEGEGFAPLVEYNTESGNKLRHYSMTYKLVSPYKVGQIVPIWYKNYKSIREATLEDDEVGTLPRNLFILGLTLTAMGLPKLVSGLMGLM